MPDGTINTRFGAFHLGDPVEFDVVGYGRLDGVVTPVGIMRIAQATPEFEKRDLPPVVSWYHVRFAKKKQQLW